MCWHAFSSAICMPILLIESAMGYRAQWQQHSIPYAWMECCGGSGGVFVSLIIRNYLLGFHFGNGALVLCR